MMTSTSIVHKLDQKDNTLHVAFRDHSGIFKIDITKEVEEKINKLKNSEKTKEALSFTYDQNLTILDIK